METNYTITVYDTANRCSYLPNGTVVLSASPSNAGDALKQLELLKSKFPEPEYFIQAYTEVVTTLRLDGIVAAEIPGFMEREY